MEDTRPGLNWGYQGNVLRLGSIMMHVNAGGLVYVNFLFVPKVTPGVTQFIFPGGTS